MKLIFFGTGTFGVPTLKRLLESEHEVLAVVTQPDRQKGRGWSIQGAPVKTFLEDSASGVKILQPEKVSAIDFAGVLKDAGADIFVVVDYGQLLSKDILDMPSKYCINLHPSLLPKYRGAAPVNYTVLNGDGRTGNTVISMNERMDAGDIILQEEIEVKPGEDALELLERLSTAGADLVIKTLDSIASGQEDLLPQNENKASYAPKLRKEEGVIDWADTAENIIRKIKGMQPWPGAYTYLAGKMLKIFKARISSDPAGPAEPGTICDEKTFVVSTGKGALEVELLQLEGKSKISAEEFLRGSSIKMNTPLGQ